MRNKILLLCLIQFILFSPKLSMAKISTYSHELHIEQEAIKIPAKKKSRRFIKKKSTDIKKKSRSLILFLASLLSIIIGINIIAPGTGTLVIIFGFLALLLGIIGVFVGLSDWNRDKSLLGGLGFILNLLITSIAICGLVLLDVF